MSAITLLYLPMPKKHTCMLVELKSTENVWSLLYWHAKLLKHVADSVTCSHTTLHPCPLQMFIRRLISYLFVPRRAVSSDTVWCRVVCHMTWCREGLCVTLHCVVKDFRVCVMTRCRMYGMTRCVYVWHDALSYVP